MAKRGAAPHDGPSAARPYHHAIEARTCYRHTDRETGRSCTRCGRPACPDCLTDAPVGAHCAECIRAARPPAGERVRRWSAGAGMLGTKTLIGLNLAVFVATSVQGGAVTGGSGDLLSRLGLSGPSVAAGEWYRLVSSGFVHFGLVHLALNLVILYRLGEMLEPALGRTRFVALYLAALLSGSFGVVLLQPNALTGGASGAVFGLMGAAAVGLRQRGINIFQTGIGTLLVVNLLFTFLAANVSVGGHLGGLAGGAAVGGVMLRTRPGRTTLVKDLAAAAVVAAVSVAGALWAAHR